MFRWRRQSRPSAPLHEWLSGRNTAWFADFTEEQIAKADDGQKLLNLLVLGGVLNCASSATASFGGRVTHCLDNVALDALAFELLAFSFYAVRESHLPTSDDPFDETDPDELIESYGFAIGAVPALISEKTGWEIDDLWQRRLMFYFQRKDMKDATESLVGILLTMKDAKTPHHDYGTLSLDLAANLKLRVIAHSFASTIPKGTADVLQGLAVEHGLIL